MEVLLTKEYITGLIEKKGMSKAEFAKQMGVARQNLDAMLESRKKDINTVIKMAEVLEMPLEEFLYGKKEDAGVRVNGFLKVNGSIVEVSSKADLERIMAELEELENKEI
jgi:transcriptional regulator with XRE-family HTH domain